MSSSSGPRGLQAILGDPNTTEPFNVHTFLPDFAKGPLDVYRDSASFHWKEMALFLDGSDVLRFKHHIFRTLEKDPEFAHISPTSSLDKQREMAQRRLKRIMKYSFLTRQDGMLHHMCLKEFVECLGMYDWSLAVKRLLNTELFGTSTLLAGKSGNGHWSDLADNLQIVGCFALTEISHGSNSKAIKTTATYDVKTKEFIIDTPNVEAAKFWVGNLGKTATHGVVFAQLITPDGVNHGLHSFVVPLRDPLTLQPLSGVIMGDMGHKIGLNGVDNGFAIFDRVRIPKSQLLNKHADVTSDGTYVTSYKDPNKRFGASLGPLSMGRVGITGMCVVNLKMLMPIAIRYSAVRKQFSAVEGGPEVPVLEYQLQQWRLFPYMAAAYALHFFSRKLFGQFMECQVASVMGSVSAETIAEMGREIHALSCSSKPLASWTAQAAAQECREACGGHGYVSCNRLGMIRNDNDPNCTFEGDNNVILQQTSNYLLTAYQNKSWNTPFKTIAFLAEMEKHLQRRFSLTNQQELLNGHAILDAYRWLVAYLLKESQKKFESELSVGKDPLRARNDSQVYYCRQLALAFVQYCAISAFHEIVWASTVPVSMQPVLRRLSALYGLWCLEKDLGFFYQGGYMQGSDPATSIRNTILSLCEALKPDSVSLVDALAPPDFILNSPIGASNGHIYRNLFSAMLQTPQVFERPEWWHIISQRSEDAYLEAKL